jgi:hypothetical protein
MLHLARGHGAHLTPDRFTWPFVAIGAVTLLALPVYLRLDRDAGSEISGGCGRPKPSPRGRGRRSREGGGCPPDEVV